MRAAAHRPTPDDAILEARAREIEVLARWAGVAAVYAPTPADENPGWSLHVVEARFLPPVVPVTRSAA